MAASPPHTSHVTTTSSLRGWWDNADLIERVASFLGCADLMHLVAALPTVSAAPPPSTKDLLSSARRASRGSSLLLLLQQGRPHPLNLPVATCLPPCLLFRNETLAWGLRLDRGPRLQATNVSSFSGGGTCIPMEVQNRELYRTILIKLACKRQYVTRAGGGAHADKLMAPGGDVDAQGAQESSTSSFRGPPP